jgi:hypothetical protein
VCIGDAADGFAGEAGFVEIFDVVGLAVEDVEQLDVDVPFFLPVAGPRVKDEGVAGHHTLIGGERALAEVTGAEGAVGAGYRSLVAGRDRPYPWGMRRDSRFR